jgi:hypothetical protein
MGRQALALLRQLDAACASADDLEAAAIESGPKIRPQLGARQRPAARRDAGLVDRG